MILIKMVLILSHSHRNSYLNSPNTNRRCSPSSLSISSRCSPNISSLYSRSINSPHTRSLSSPRLTIISKMHRPAGILMCRASFPVSIRNTSNRLPMARILIHNRWDLRRHSRPSRVKAVVRQSHPWFSAFSPC